MKDIGYTVRRIYLSFYECEHSRDLDRYIADVYQSGGSITQSTINDEAETCSILVEVNDFEEFKRRFRNTESFGFSNMY